MYSTSKRLLFGLALCLLYPPLNAQDFYFGADLSYVNEMQDCGEDYLEESVVKDPYQIFADHNCNLVRLRLWHTPSWYDDLNSGQRYSDFADVRRSIIRAKQMGMQVLLDFHLSDNWADPSKQIVPAAWLEVVDDLPVLKDSLYNYISTTLIALAEEGLLPEMVQIGNETNKGILQSPEDNQEWMLDWDRNSQLFNRAIEAVRDVQDSTNTSIKIALHIADPDNLGWLLEGFTNHGVTDYDVIGMSYYWAWHQPTSIAQVGELISQLRQAYPGKDVMVFETAYIWTWESNDNANNIINDVHDDYAPPSPENQREWLIDLTEAVMGNGGTGVIYWEPAWISSPCYTQWGQGSHQEHATFFDFDNNLLEQGGIGWMTHDYTTAIKEPPGIEDFKCFLNETKQLLHLEFQNTTADSLFYLKVASAEGRILMNKKIETIPYARLIREVVMPDLPAGVYVVGLYSKQQLVGSRKLTVVK
ncbi:MAG: hypothetical protein DHS20C18_33300 [Saprospiraceae bacterium]|nr:MAG: hypothetical protein DHS20C18_33300 [Saprospiraceae bacterium]